MSYNASAGEAWKGIGGAQEVGCSGVRSGLRVGAVGYQVNGTPAGTAELIVLPRFIRKVGRGGWGER